MSSTVTTDRSVQLSADSPRSLTSNGESADKSSNGVVNLKNTSSSSQFNGMSQISTDASHEKCKRITISNDELANITGENLISLWTQQNAYIDSLEAKIDRLESVHILSTKEWKEKLLESTRRENLLILTVSCKEKQISQLNEQLNDVRRLQLPNECQLRSTLLDPAVNLIFESMRKEVSEAKMKVEETENELSAWKFTPDSNTGKRLMAKCRMLYQENEELGKVISSGRLAKLEGELELQKELAGNIEKSQSEIEELVFELEENSLGLQSTIINLQQQLKESKENETKLLERLNKVAPNQSESDGVSCHATASVDETDKPSMEGMKEITASDAPDDSTLKSADESSKQAGDNSQIDDKAVVNEPMDVQ